MKPVRFEEVNAVIGEKQPEYEPLPALIKDYEVEGQVLERAQVVTCWDLTDEEIADIVKNKKIWLSTLTFGYPFQPVCLTTKKEDLI